MLPKPPAPRIPRPAPRRPPQPKRMTIAAGFVCRDGLLFASDTLITGEQRRYGQKFWTSSFGPTEVVFGGSGMQAVLLRARDEIERRAQPTEDRYDVIGAIEEALTIAHEKYKPTDLERTGALVGIRTPEGCWLYENQDGRSMLNVVERNCICVGYGQSLGAYFADSLFRDNMTLEWAKHVAAYLIKQVTVYSSGFCGGRANLLELPTSGHPRWTTNKADIAKLTDYLAGIDGAMQLVLPDKRTNDDTVRYRIEKLKETIEGLRQQFVIKMQHGEVSISGGVARIYADPIPLTPESSGVWSIPVGDKKDNPSDGD